MLCDTPLHLAPASLDDRGALDRWRSLGCVCLFSGAAAVVGLAIHAIHQASQTENADERLVALELVHAGDGGRLVASVEAER